MLKQARNSHPDLLIVWNPEIDCGVDYSVEVWEKDITCEKCGHVGSYIMRDDDNSQIGVCRSHLEEEANGSRKTIMKVFELDRNHEY